jgi:hypothetical protein
MFEPETSFVEIVWKLPAATGRRGHPMPFGNVGKSFPNEPGHFQESVAAGRGWLYLNHVNM